MKHLRILKTLNFIMAGLVFVLGVGALVSIFVPLGCPCSGSGTISVFGGGFTFALMMALAVAHVVVGFMVTAGRARLAQTILAVLQLFKFPFGTAFGVYALWVCWRNPPSKRAFEAEIKPRIS